MRATHDERHNGRHTDDTPDGIPLLVPDAAKALGISPEAVRNRLSRGTLRSVKREGRVFVLIDRNMARHTERSTDDTSTDTSDLMEEMRARIEDLRDQLAEEREARRRADTIIMQLTQANASLAARIPELEASPLEETAEAHQEDPQEPRHGTGGVQDGERAEKRPWWRRMFG